MFDAGPGIRDVIAGSLAPVAAVDFGVVHVLAGDALLLERFALTFHVDTVASPLADDSAAHAA